MAETLLEISSKNGVLSDGNNSTFKTVFGEPIRVSAGSTINFQNAFIDLGLESADLIAIPYNLRLGINFHRFDEDIPRVPKTQGTDPTFYQKATMYYEDDNLISQYDAEPDITYGLMLSTHRCTLLPAFLMTRQNRNVANSIVQETFTSIEQTATIDIPAGFYSRTKFIQLVNDGFNLINGSLTNTDKPLESKKTVNNPTYGDLTELTPYDYQQAPNNNNQLLKSYEYSYATRTTAPGGLQTDTDLVPNPPAIYPHQTPTFKTYITDKTWNDWFFPVYTVPSDPDLFYEEQYPGYVWMATNQTGFLAGTTKFNLNYDQDNQLFFIDYTHSPILDGEQREIVQFSNQKTRYVGLGSGGAVDQNTGYKANGRAGGIMISRLFSLQLDNTFTPISNDNTNFWQKYLGFGFDDAYQTQFNADFKTETRTFWGFGFLKWEQTLNYPDPKYFDIATTNALIPIAWLQQQNWTDPDNDRGFSIVVNDIPKTFQSIGSRNILGTGGAQFVEPDAYFLVEVNINGARTDNYRDKDSYRQIMACCGKTYPSTASYIQSFADNVVQSIVMTDDITIDTIEVRLLRPDKTPALELGANSTVFLKIVQPIQVQAPQPQ
jgi:hypothetical protein